MFECGVFVISLITVGFLVWRLSRCVWASWGTLLGLGGKLVRAALCLATTAWQLATLVAFAAVLLLFFVGREQLNAWWTGAALYFYEAETPPVHDVGAWMRGMSGWVRGARAALRGQPQEQGGWWQQFNE